MGLTRSLGLKTICHEPHKFDFLFSFVEVVMLFKQWKQVKLPSSPATLLQWSDHHSSFYPWQIKRMHKNFWKWSHTFPETNIAPQNFGMVYFQGRTVSLQGEWSALFSGPAHLPSIVPDRPDFEGWDAQTQTPPRIRANLHTTKNPNKKSLHLESMPFFWTSRALRCHKLRI